MNPTHHQTPIDILPATHMNTRRFPTTRTMQPRLQSPDGGHNGERRATMNTHPPNPSDPRPRPPHSPDKTVPRLVAIGLLLVAAAAGFAGWAWWQSTDTPATPAPDQTHDVTDLFERGDKPPCTQVFAPGRPTADVLADNNAGPCTQPDGTLLLNIVVSWDCPDGTTIHQVDGQGWGNSAGVWNGPDVPAPYADCVAPGTDEQHP